MRDGAKARFVNVGCSTQVIRTRLSLWRSILAFEGVGNFDRGHARGLGGGDAEVSIFEDEAIGWVNAQSFGGQQVRLGVRFGTGVIFGADKNFEAVEKAELRKGALDGVATAAGDDGEGNAAMGIFDVLEHFGDGGELRQSLMEIALLDFSCFGDGEGEALGLAQVGQDLLHWAPAPGVEKLFGKLAVQSIERAPPSEVVERHGIHDGAVAVEKVGLELARG